jgi:hypothetical protein
MTRFAPLVVVTLIAPSLACDPLGFWGDETPVDTPDEGNEGEGEGDVDPDPPFLPCCDFDRVDVSDDPYALQLNRAGVAQMLALRPFTDVGVARPLSLLTDAGSGMATENVLPDASNFDGTLVIDGNTTVLVETTNRSVSVLYREGARRWNGDDAYDTFDPLLVDHVRAGARKDGGLVLLVATVIVTTNDDNPSCLPGNICRTYGLVYVEGETGNWLAIPMESNQPAITGDPVRGTDLHLVRSRGERFDDTVIANVPADDPQTFGNTEVKVDAQGKPHVLVYVHGGSFYLRPN